MPPEKKKKWSTPSILLVDKQISAEALDILYAKPLIFDSKAPSKPWSTAVKDIRTYISKKTLQRLRFAIVKINLNCTEDKFGAASWWMKNVNILLKVWYEKNKMEQLTIRASHTTPHPLHARKTRYHRIMCEIINKVCCIHNTMEYLLIVYQCEKFGRDALVVVVIEPKIDT